MRVCVCVCLVVEKFLCIVTGRDRAVRCRTSWLALGEKRLQADSDGGLRQQNCHDFSLGILGILLGSSVAGRPRGTDNGY